MPKGESNKLVYDTPRKPAKPSPLISGYDGTQHPWEFSESGILEPSPTDPDTVYGRSRERRRLIPLD